MRRCVERLSKKKAFHRNDNCSRTSYYRLRTIPFSITQRPRHGRVNSTRTGQPTSPQYDAGHWAKRGLLGTPTRQPKPARQPRRTTRGRGCFRHSGGLYRPPPPTLSLLTCHSGNSHQPTWLTTIVAYALSLIFYRRSRLPNASSSHRRPFTNGVSVAHFNACQNALFTHDLAPASIQF